MPGQLGHSKPVLLERVDFEMDQSQQELRHAANKAFMESLDHLGMRLQPSDGEPAVSAKSAPPKSLPPIDLESLEAAAEDIAEYMKTLGGEESAQIDREREAAEDSP
jgi:hypothetical protein